MSKPTYDGTRGLVERELVWLGSGIKTPPFSLAGRIEAGHRLRLLQRGERIGMPHSRPMPSIGPRCHELRVRDADHSWRLVYRIDPDAIVIVEVFAKSSGRTPLEIVGLCRRRLCAYDEAATGGHQG